ncbi:putative disease resistance protein RGA3 [Salvia hispanica]|uniref:putative disease resistance protein RGA3 n=1 Tax=Salvia hispanica TaxID=49212 RepID=UPI0020090AA3|nr:putative disease resistance protein RGA3 [Salvia hispanica]
MEGVSSASIEVLLQNLINLFSEEYSLLRSFDEDAQQLQRTLGMIQAYLNDAEKKSITQDAVKLWLRELEAVAFDAENILDELSYHLLHKKVKKMKSSKDKSNRSWHSKHGCECTCSAVAHTSVETDSFSLDPIFIGRDEDLPKLVDILTQKPPVEEKRVFSSLALVGMGGMGKTTLTRKVFNHERVKARFGSLIWVHVSQTFDAISLFNKILYKVTKKASDGVENSDDILEKTQKALKARVESRDDILEKLQEALKGKTYLLVLDDVWNDDVSKWEGFINSVLGVTSTKGNGIIVTTRSENVASIVNPFHIHHLNGLSDEDCWSIIKVKTFDENGEVPSRLEMIGRKIAKRCQGMPLAANVVGGVLRGKPEEEWSFINENWFSDAKGGENISKILKLSYDHLSSPWLKKCFTFCSIFPKGREIKKEELIELWMGEEFLQPSRRNYMEFVGNMFFNVLLQNSLLQVQWKDIYGNVLYCVMHDLVHDLASSILANNADGSIVIRYKFLEEESSPIPKNVAKHLRTLFLKGGIPGTILSNFQCLHNLTLSGD